MNRLCHSPAKLSAQDFKGVWETGCLGTGGEVDPNSKLPINVDMGMKLHGKAICESNTL